MKQMNRLNKQKIDVCVCFEVVDLFVEGIQKL